MTDTDANRTRERGRTRRRDAGIARDPGRTPPADVAETADEVTITVDLSGTDPGNAGVLVSRDLLYVETRPEPREGSADRERVARTVALPQAVGGSDATASLRNGVLTVTLPKEPTAGTDDGTWIPVSRPGRRR